MTPIVRCTNLVASVCMSKRNTSECAMVVLFAMVRNALYFTIRLHFFVCSVLASDTEMMVASPRGDKKYPKRRERERDMTDHCVAVHCVQ